MNMNFSIDPIMEMLIGIAIICTFVIYWKQLKTMRESLELTRQVNLGQNLISLHNFFLDPEFREIRIKLINLHGKPLASWSKEERESAERVCTSWNFICSMVKKNILPEWVLEDVKYSLLKCHESAEELLLDVRKNRSPDHWNYFSDYANKISHSFYSVVK